MTSKQSNTDIMRAEAAALLQMMDSRARLYPTGCKKKTPLCIDELRELLRRLIEELECAPHEDVYSVVRIVRDIIERGADKAIRFVNLHGNNETKEACEVMRKQARIHIASLTDAVNRMLAANDWTAVAAYMSPATGGIAQPTY